MKRRVLFLDPAGRLYGSEQSLLTTLEALKAFDIEMALCLPPKGLLHAEALSRGIRCYPVFRDLKSNGTLLNKIRALLGAFYACVRFRPEIIHLNQAGVLRYVRIISKILKIPLTVSVRMDEDVEFVCSHAGDCSRIMFLPNTEAIRSQLIEGGIPPERTELIRVPIENPEDEQVPEDLTMPGKTVVGFVGRVCRSKGVDVFVEAMLRICEQHTDVVALVVGASGEVLEGGTDCLVEMEHRVQKAGLSDQIVFTGFRRDVEGIFQRMDVFVNASDEEAFGRSICEALVRGTPVVATDVGGVHEVVSHGKTGLLVAARNATALVDAIEDTLDDRAAAAARSRNGAAWINFHCSPERVASRLFAVYLRSCDKSESTADRQ